MYLELAVELAVVSLAAGPYVSAALDQVTHKDVAVGPCVDDLAVDAPMVPSTLSNSTRCTRVGAATVRLSALAFALVVSPVGKPQDGNGRPLAIYPLDVQCCAVGVHLDDVAVYLAIYPVALAQPATRRRCGWRARGVNARSHNPTTVGAVGVDCNAKSMRFAINDVAPVDALIVLDPHGTNVDALGTRRMTLRAIDPTPVDALGPRRPVERLPIVLYAQLAP
jgi:hypothetical protein